MNTVNGESPKLQPEALQDAEESAGQPLYAFPEYPRSTSPTHAPLTIIPPTPTTSTLPPRASLESVGIPTSSHAHDSLTADGRPATLATIPSESGTLVEPSFDETVLRALCQLDCGVPLLLDRIKQSIVSCREAATFFKKRATLEDDYAKNLQKLARATSDTYSMNDGKAGSYVNAWQRSLKIQDTMAENRIRFAQRLSEMSDELNSLGKEVEKSRKQTKELASRYERALQDSELVTEKCKARLDITSEELERVLLQKEGESVKESGVHQGRSPHGAAGGKRALGKAVVKGGLLLKGKNPGSIQRQEEDVRNRMSIASDAYRKAVTETQTVRQEYFNLQLPRILRALKECADEIDLGTQYHLTRYAFLHESVVLTDGATLVPPESEDASPGLKATIETIDNRADFRTYMQNYAYAHGSQPTRGPRREGPEEQGFLPPLPAHSDRMQQTLISPLSTTGPPLPDKPRPTFGVDLAEQMARDSVDVPPIMEKCCRAIEKYGMQLQGIYRLSGTTSKIQKLKEKLDRDIDSVNLDADEWAADINNVTSVIKLWLRELPDPLICSHLHHGFMDAAKIENDRLRHIRLHERVNDLPDPNYATLKYFLGHLHRINQYAAQNSMSIQNLAIVFGPTLFSPTHVNGSTGHMNGGASMADTVHQTKAIETILEHYSDIFIDETEADENA